MFSHLKQNILYVTWLISKQLVVEKIIYATIIVAPIFSQDILPKSSIDNNWNFLSSHSDEFNSNIID